MADPLSPLSESGRNARTPQSTSRFRYKTTVEDHEETATNMSFYETHESFEHSLPFDEQIDFTNKIRSTNASPVKSPTRNRSKSRSPSKSQSPRKALAEESPSRPLTKDALRENEGLTKAIDIMSQDHMNDKENGIPGTPQSTKSRGIFDDDTCISAFSEIPTDMTRFVRLGGSPIRDSPTKPQQSPSKIRTPRSSRPNTPGTARVRPHHYDASPTPRKREPLSSDDATTQLLEFTGAINYPTSRHSPHKLRSPTKDGFQAASPSQAKNFANLLDFDLGPAPSPRSIPRFSPREVDSIKVEYESAIAKLQAALDSRDADAQNLVEARNDAERRAGESSEALAESQSKRAALETENVELEQKRLEMANILKGVKSELYHRQKETETLSTRLEESQRALDSTEARAAEAEARLVEAESKISTLSLARASPETTPPSTDGPVIPPSTPITNKTVEAACARVAKDLHDLYKEKHNKKIESLRKTYNDRWQNKVSQLQFEIDRLGKDNLALREGRDATLTKAIPMPREPGVDVATSPRKDLGETDTASATAALVEKQILLEQAEQRYAQTQAELSTIVTQIEGLGCALADAKSENKALRQDLEVSRQENGELVAAVEQMLSLDPAAAGAALEEASFCAGGMAPVGEAAGRPGSALSRPGSGMARPGSAMSARAAEGMDRNGSHDGSGRMGSGLGSSFGAPAGRSGLKAPGSAFGFKRSVSASQQKGGLMSSIERMGRGV
ncbi:MAG: hypothetical protein MMC23_008439 [Stictis urceolatum]|nr:hypothetical protein [Stictis urceolata]